MYVFILLVEPYHLPHFSGRGAFTFNFFFKLIYLHLISNLTKLHSFQRKEGYEWILDGRTKGHEIMMKENIENIVKELLFNEI